MITYINIEMNTWNNRLGNVGQQPPSTRARRQLPPPGSFHPLIETVVLYYPHREFSQKFVLPPVEQNLNALKNFQKNTNKRDFLLLPSRFLSSF